MFKALKADMAMAIWALQQKNGMGQWTGVDTPKTVTTTRTHAVLTYSVGCPILHFFLN